MAAGEALLFRGAHFQYYSSPAAGRMTMAFLFVIFLVMIPGLEVAEAANRTARTARGGLWRSGNHSAAVQPPEWMQAPLFHSPRVFAADYAEMKKNFKVYFYPYPANETDKFGFSGREPLPAGNYASELYFFRNFNETEFLTQDPEKAHLFVLPFSIFKIRMSIGPNKVTDYVKLYMEETLKTKWPYWNRSNGADHLYGTCHDLGVQAAQTTSGLSGSALQVICPANRWHRNYIPTKDFSFPQIWPRYDSPPGGLTAEER